MTRESIGKRELLQILHLIKKSRRSIWKILEAMSPLETNLSGNIATSDMILASQEFNKTHLHSLTTNQILVPKR